MAVVVACCCGATPSSPTTAAPYTDSNTSRTCSIPSPLNRRLRSRRWSGIRKVREVKQACRVFAASAPKAHFQAALFSCALHLVGRLHITSIPARYPQLWGVVSGSFSSFPPPAYGGVTQSFPAAMLPVHWETIKNFGAVNIWSTSDLSCGHLDNRESGAAGVRRTDGKPVKIIGGKRLDQGNMSGDKRTAAATLLNAMAAIDAGTSARGRVATEKFWRRRGQFSRDRGSEFGDSDVGSIRRRSGLRAARSASRYPL